ncbi:glycoside hydrolase family 3 protein [Penicillium cinerascens]|uniref:beta-glucosidase n=1 Tax=Penicillium cinerascens TaxID=70096 RepID=A0A9W9NFS9_9EURO|nr:glycoside hydrolase family 3 protein [Penicillium cinerascens]KAJ5217943.1 glycoside hydrolase family 3 protein [Penicillium cinerascens]
MPASPPSYPSPWMNPNVVGWEEAYEKAKSFVSQMTLLEKVNLTTGTGWESDQCVGNTGSVPRLGFNGFCTQDSPVGVRLTDYNTVFPGGVTAAATWDRSLMYARGLAMGQEHRGKGSTVQLGPVCGPLGRAPEAGRNWEGFSPDPVLTGVGVSETIKGIQDAGVIACVKHFIGYEQEHFRSAGQDGVVASYSSNVDDQTMHELYLWPFADAVRAGVGSVMCSYNQLNNSYACQNSKVLNGLLKNELGFQGFVMSDWTAQLTGVASAVAGLDMTMPGDTAFDSGLSFWGANLTLSVINGTVPSWRIDDMAMRIMAAYFKVGRTLEDQPPVTFDSWSFATEGPLHFAANEGYQQINYHVDVRGNHAKVARQVAAEGSVLLKNNGILPLKKVKQIAVIGSDAGPNLDGPNGCSDRGCDNGTLGMAWGSGTANFAYLVTPDAALQARAIQEGSAYQAIFDDYVTDDSNTQQGNGLTAIPDLVSQAETVSIVFVNADSGEGYITVGGNIGDRNNLTLWHGGDDLIRNVSALCDKTVVVIHSVGSVIVDDWFNNPNISAVVWAGIPGEQSGNAITDVLYGDVNPSGKSPFSWVSDRTQVPDVMYEPNNGDLAPQIDFTEGVFIDYRALDKADIIPTLEFGFGLSYTTFEYSNIQVKKNSAPPYKSTTGRTIPAPTLGTFSTALSDYLFPGTWKNVLYFIYPYFNSTDPANIAGTSALESACKFLPPNATDGKPQPFLPAGGGPGGNPLLYDELYTVTAAIKNTGSVAGAEVPQLYVSLGGPNDPKVQLRGFDKLFLNPGETGEFSVQLTRRDISNWDVVTQNWYISDYPKKVYIGASSRKLHLSAWLN